MPSPTLEILGCRLAFDAKTPELPQVAGFLGAFPAQYIVRSHRGYFDANFQEIGPKLQPVITDQDHDDCVGHGCHVLKSAQEGVKVSPRDGWRLGKRLDGYPLDSFGTTIFAVLDAYVAEGVAEERLVPSKTGMTRAQYLSLADETPEIIANRKRHKGLQPYFVPRTRAQELLLSTDLPTVTSCLWYPQDNAIGADGLMRMPMTGSGTGHCVACIGWVLRLVGGVLETCFVMVNSFGPGWGRFGLFYVPMKDVINRFGNFYTILDEETNPTLLKAKYDGKNVIVAGRPEHWKIEGGKRRQYRNEIEWWSHGNLFGIDIFELVPNELDVFEVGAPMGLGPKAELIRQLRQHYGLN